MTTASRAADLFDAVLTGNPFTDNRINAPSDDDVDVADLNRTAFERLTALAGEALERRRGIGVMVWGEAGVGKSHLLSRLDRWSRNEGQACSIYLHNLLASPSNLPRILIRNLIGKLAWTATSSFRSTTLFEMISAAVERALGNINGFRSWSILRQTLLDVLLGGEPSGPSDAGLADQTVVDVMFRFYRSVLRRAQGKEDGATAALAVQWLRGETIPAAQAHSLLGLPPSRSADGPVLIDDAQQVKQVLAALSRLFAACGRPFILAFDQVDNLDDSQLTSLSRFLEAVIDSSRNLLVVTAGIQSSLLGARQRGLIQDSAWDRIAQIQLQLLKCTPMQARQLLKVRLEKFFEPFVEVQELRRTVFDHDLFPLGTRWFEHQIGTALEVRPREILSAAREAWTREQGWLRQSGGSRWLAEWPARQDGPDGVLPPVSLTPLELNELIDRTVQERMDDHIRRVGGVVLQRESAAECLAQLLEERRRFDPSAALLRVQRSEEVENKHAGAYHLFLDHRCADGSEARTGLTAAYGQSAASLVYVLSRMREDDTPPRRVMILAGEKGLSLGERGEEHLSFLKQRPGSLVEILNVSDAELIRLDAAAEVWRMARGEDLEVVFSDGRTRAVSADEVILSHERRGRFAALPALIAAARPPAPAPMPAAPSMMPTIAPIAATVAVAGAAIAVAAVAVPMAMPVAEAEPVAEAIPMWSPDDMLLDEEPAVAVPVAAPVEAVAEDEIEAMLFGEQTEVAEPVAAVEVEEEAAILLDDEQEAVLYEDDEEPVAAEAILIDDDELDLSTEVAEAELIDDDAGTVLLDDGVIDLEEEE